MSLNRRIGYQFIPLALEMHDLASKIFLKFFRNLITQEAARTMKEDTVEEDYEF